MPYAQIDPSRRGPGTGGRLWGAAAGTQCRAVREAGSKLKNWVPGQVSAPLPAASPIRGSLPLLSTQTSASWVPTSWVTGCWSAPWPHDWEPRRAPCSVPRASDGGGFKSLGPCTGSSLLVELKRPQCKWEALENTEDESKGPFTSFPSLKRPIFKKMSAPPRHSHWEAKTGPCGGLPPLHTPAWREGIRRPAPAPWSKPTGAGILKRPAWHKLLFSGSNTCFYGLREPRLSIGRWGMGLTHI